MNKKIDIGQKAKVSVKWNVPISDYTPEMEKNIISLMAKKYGIPSKNITVEVNHGNSANNGVITTDSVQSMHDPKFQQELMKEYIKVNDIKDVDFDEIVKIDSRINSLIDYDAYDKGKRYTIKWIKWSNFLSYGPNNFFDFTKLKGLVLLNGEPANKSGKSTFAYDLIHFLLFGKTNTEKADNLAGLFNNYLPDENSVSVEGCINIDGEDFIIKRTLTRPSKGKKSRNVTNKVEYFKIGADGTEIAIPDENLQGETTTATSKIIKEALGNESDFDMVISANAKDLDSLINLTKTEKGRLLTRWIGLSIIEDKDVKAREMWNKSISVGRYCDIYNQVTIEGEIEQYTKSTSENEDEIKKLEKSVLDSEKNIAEFSKNRDALIFSKQPIDESFLKVDVASLENRIQSIIETGKRKVGEMEAVDKEIKDMGVVEYSEEDFKALRKERDGVFTKITSLNTSISSLRNTNEALKKSEFCPTCHRKLDNVDHQPQIKANEDNIEKMSTEVKTYSSKLNELETAIKDMDQKRALVQQKSKLELKKATLSADIANGRAEYKEKKALLNEIQKNKEAIAKNSEIDARINVIDASIKSEENVRKQSQNNIDDLKRENTRYAEAIKERKGWLVKINEERKTEKYWKLYLQMIGKDGIGKMVLRNTLPIINSELNKLLNDVADFKVEIVMNEKNDVGFFLIRDNVITRLSGASGLEKTQAALALRVVLGKMSTLSRPPFLFLDEILGTVAKENYDDMKKLYDKISAYYEFILHITHLPEVVDWHDSIITVQKLNNISRIKGDN